jgi:hypothetical protein
MRFSFIGTVLCLACVASAAPAQASTISLELASPAIVGAPFDVLVEADDVFAGQLPGDTLVAFAFDVGVTGTSVNYVDETIGPLFFDIPSGTPFVEGFALDPAGIGPGDFVGSLTLATLHFAALAPGTSTISVTGDDSLFEGLVFSSAFAPITASLRVTAAEVPEPATMTLFGSGLALAWRARRRRR